MFKNILCFCLLLFAYSINAQIPTINTKDVVELKGTGGLGTKTLAINPGHNRVLVVQLWFERFMTTEGNNWPSSTVTNTNSNDVASMPEIAVTYSGTTTNLIKRAPNYYGYREGSSGSNLITDVKLGTVMYTYTIEIPNDTPTNIISNINLNLNSFSAAKNSNDEAVALIEVYNNVSRTTTYANTGGAFWSADPSATNSSGASSSNTFNINVHNSNMNATNLVVPKGRNFNEILFLGVGALSKNDADFRFDANWTELHRSVMVNTGNGYNPGGTSNYPVNENDGVTFLSATRTLNSRPTGGSAFFTADRSNSDRILIARFRTFALLPSAKPQYTGKVLRDTDGASSVNGTSGANIGAPNVNIVENGVVVFSAPVDGSGNFTIPEGVLVEGKSYDFILATTPTATTPSITPGWTFVGDSKNGTSYEGTADGKLNITVGATELASITFGINTCSAGNVKPPVANRNLNFTCPVTGVDLASANVTPAPAGSSIVWFTTNDHSGTALTAAQVANAPAGTYYSYYYDSIAGCYSLASDPVVVTSLCATDDNFSVSSGVTGGSAGNVLTNDRLNGVQPTASNVSLIVVTPAAPINGSTNVPTIDASGNVNVPANTPGGTYNITYRICVTPAGTPCDDAIVKVTVPFTVQTTPDVVTTPAGVATSIPNVLANDRYNYGTTAPVVGTNVTLSAVGTWPHGITLNSNGSVTVPNNVPVGTHTMQYQVCTTGATPECKTETVTVNVTNNPILTAVDDINQTEQNKPISGNVLTNDESSSANTVTSATAKGPNGSTVTLTPGTSSVIYGDNGLEAGTIVINADGTYTFTPKAEFIGDVTLNYATSNTEGLNDTASLNIKVSPKVNVAGTNPPIAQNDVAFTEINKPVVVSPKANDSDPSGNIASATISGLNQRGVAVTNGGIVSGVDQNGTAVVNAGTLTFNSNGTYTFNPAAGFVGTVNPITYTLTDAEGLTDTADMFITVENSVNSAQNNTYANDDAIVGVSGVILQGNVLTNDTDPEGNSHTVTSATVNGVPMTIGTSTTLDDIGRVKINSDGSYAFSPLNPNTDFVGTITVIYTKCDNGNPQACDTATLYITALDTESYCYKPAKLTGVVMNTNVGISTIGQGENWPQNRKGAFIAIESKTKGLVISRMTTTEMNSIPNPQFGMTVYDTVDDCMKVYGKGPNNSIPGWYCYNLPACND